MRLMYWGKDGGKESNVSGFWPIEIKSIGSAALLRFDDGTRDAYHSHAFNSISWLLSGQLIERQLNGGWTSYIPSWWPIVTRRSTFHQVESKGRSWVLTFRGPWSRTWQEYIPTTGEQLTLMNGRVRV